jgi:hypothetical protein
VRGRGRGRGGGWRVGQQACIFNVRLGLGEIEGRYRDKETKKQRDIETEMTIKILKKPGQPT